ncbi:hypothetical protein PVBG_03307 [Plasmodium vivax Brazil I]|uniref:Uncharacterized protein n=1 Tax=Plasmodium vivax (strain Brazil I) TaxID=1033975 RepID=A0A0J9T3I9_PLAV1|nr:hypothetical protein PVBG_03307 [Plasmodium vivax Brazil I]
MLVIKNDDFFDKLEEKYPFLWGFPLSKIYELFILSAKTENTFQVHCNDLKKNDSTCDLRHICTSVATLLLRLKDKFEHGERVSTFAKQCEYLNYWIYYNIKDSLKCNNISMFYERLNGIKQGLIPNGHTCDIQDFNIDKEEFLQKKTLFFHTEILHWFKNKYKGINNNDRTKYNEYLVEAYNFYKDIICSADSQIKANFNEELTKFKNIFNDTITYLKEKPIGIWQSVIPEKNESMCTNVLPRTERVISQAGREEYNVLSRQKVPLGSEGPKEQGEQGGEQERPGESGLSGLLVTAGDAPSILQDFNGQVINGGTPEEVRPSKASTIASSLAGSCFFLGMMYKIIKWHKYIFTEDKYYIYIMLIFLCYHCRIMYDFFDNIPTYINNVETAKNDNNELNHNDDCDGFSKQYTKDNISIGKNICEQFIKLCKQLPNVIDYNTRQPNYINDWNFLSYWLNIKIKESKLNGTICPDYFYSGMENHCIKTLPFSSQTNFIYNINKEDLGRMEILYILYKNYNKLDTIINNVTPQEPKSLLEPSRTCSNNYKIGRSMCYGKYNKFCEKLKDFKTKYENLYKTAESKGDQYTNNFKKLTDYENSNIISSTVIGSAAGLIPLFGILYKVGYLIIKF